MRLICAPAPVVMAGAALFCMAACGDGGETTSPEVTYRDQTFSLLARDGNHAGNDVTGWDHDGAAVCTLDWNGDGTGPNAVPVTYVFDDYPVVDGVAEKLLGARGGDYYLWETTPWTVVKMNAMTGNGSGVTEIWVKALFTYYKTPRIWLLLRWEDPSRTIQPVSSQQPAPHGGTHHYYWLQTPNQTQPGEGFLNGRQWDSREDWLALAWSTWFLRNTADPRVPADPTGHDWEFVETVPGFQERGIEVCRGSGDVVYRTPPVNTAQPPYNQVGYPGAYCDMWFFTASRSNYSGEGWAGSAWLFDLYIDEQGFKKPPRGSNSNPRSLDENFTFDEGVTGYEPNGGVTGYPVYISGNGPADNPPGPPYLWKPTAVPFVPNRTWNPAGGARIPGYLHRPPYGSAADVIGCMTWEQPNRELYGPWEGTPHNPHPNFKANEYGRDWHYTLEIEREIGTIDKIDPTEDVLLGIFEAH